MEEKKNIFVPVMMGLLVVAAFFVGSMWTKLRMIEGKDENDKEKTAEVKKVEGERDEAEFVVGDLPKVTEEDHYRGSKNAKVVIVEYSDFECPFCSRFNETMLQVMENYGDQVAWVYRHYALSMHANAQKFAEASECAAELGGNDAFWMINDIFYERMEAGLDLSQVASIGNEIGVDGASLEACMNEGRYEEKVKNQFKTGQTAGVRGTPGSFIVVDGENKEMIPGALPYSEVSKMIDKYL